MVYVPIVAVRTFGISRSAARYAERLASHQLILTMIEKMRVRLYDMAERSAKQTKLGTGEMLGLLSEDVERLQDAYLKTIFPSIGAFAFICRFDWSTWAFSWPFAGLMSLIWRRRICIPIYHSTCEPGATNSNEERQK